MQEEMAVNPSESSEKMENGFCYQHFSYPEKLLNRENFLSEWEIQQMDISSRNLLTRHNVLDPKLLLQALHW